MEETTHLEDFLLSVELLPNDIRRDFELMRELDRESLDSMRELNELEQKFVHRTKARKISHDNGNDGKVKDVAAMEEITAVRQRCKQRLAQKSAIAANLLKVLENFIRKLDSDLAFFETELRGCGEFEQLSRGVEAGSDVSQRSLGPMKITQRLFGPQVAIKVSLSSSEIILGRVICYRADVGMYDIADIDDSKRYNLPENQVAVLDLADSQRKLCKGEEVFAVYPDTTSFYPASVTQAPRRSTTGAEPTVTVQFHGDADETGENEGAWYNKNIVIILLLSKLDLIDAHIHCGCPRGHRWLPL